MWVPGLLAADIDWIDDEFQAVLDKVRPWKGPGRDLPFPFIDRRPRLCELLDHPGIELLVTLLLGPDANYLGSTGGYFTGDTAWHRDQWQDVSQRMKVAVYLDELGSENGCLRVVPASHALGDGVKWPSGNLAACQKTWGIDQRDLPAMPIPTSPGDVGFVK